MKYHVDPQSGSDANPAGDPSRPWRTFSPLAGVTLGGDDRVEVIRSGPLTSTLVLHGRGTCEKPIRVRFAPGRYDLYPDDTHHKAYHISNTNSDPDTPKAIGILVENAEHVLIEGQDALLMCRGKMIELCIDHSRHVTVSGLRFDYHRPTVSEFTVIDAQSDCADILVHRDSAYEIASGSLIWVGEGWRFPPCKAGILAQRLDHETQYLSRCADPLSKMNVQEIEPFKLRCRGEHNFRKGDTYQVRDTHRDCVGVFMNRSEDVQFKDLRFFFMHGMGILCQFTRDIALERVAIAPDAASGRTTSAWADCLHASGCAGGIVVRECVFDGAHDDAINIHGTYLRVTGRPKDNQVRVRFMHPQTYGFEAFIAGDEIEFVRGDSLATYAHNRVTGARMLSPHEMLLTLETPAPSDLRETDAVENVTWTPEIEVTGCTVMHIPTRGFLLTSRRKSVIENNRFIRTFMNGISVSADAMNWFESGCVRDMTIRHNVFDHCGRCAIQINPNVTAADAVVHRNIRIIDNQFSPAGRREVEIKNAVDVEVRPPSDGHP